MIKQEYNIGQLVKSSLSDFTCGVHMITGVELIERKGQHDEPAGECIKYYLDGNKEKGVYASYLQPFIDYDAVKEIVSWLKSHINDYLCVGQEGNAFCKVEMYHDLEKHMGVVKIDRL